MNTREAGMGEQGNVLVVDDEDTTRMLLETALEDAGFAITTKGSLEAGIEATKADSFDVVLIDKNLDDKDGVDLLRHIKQHHPTTECILMTAYATLESALAAIQLGIFDYMTKPFDHMFSVVQRVGRAVQKKRQAEEIEALFGMLSVSNLALDGSELELRRTHHQTASALSRLVGMRNPRHTREGVRLKELATRLAQDIGMDAESVRWVGLASLVRDVGMIGELHDIVAKSGELSGEERNRVQEHSTTGAEILAMIPGFQQLSSIVKHHHERFDGNGYPDGLKGDDIPLTSRVLAVSDAFVAMRSERPHRPALSEEEALGVLETESGKQFDPRVAQALIGMLRRTHGEVTP